MSASSISDSESIEGLKRASFVHKSIAKNIAGI